MISCMTMIFTLHFTLNNFCEPQKYEHFLSKMFFKAYYRIILRKFGRKFLSLNKSSKKEKYFFHLCPYYSTCNRASADSTLVVAELRRGPLTILLALVLVLALPW